MLELILPISVDMKPTKFPFKVYEEMTAGKAGKGEMHKINIVIDEIIISIIVDISYSNLIRKINLKYLKTYSHQSLYKLFS